jgi:hypothetical protein
MNSYSTKKLSRKRAVIRALGLGLGGLAPLATGLVGMWGYATRGYFIAKTGETIDGPLGMVASGLFIFAGLCMIGYAIWSYRRKREIDRSIQA